MSDWHRSVNIPGSDRAKAKAAANGTGAWHSPEQIAGALGGAKREGREWKALCPCHPDKDPSLSITEKDGKILLICRSAGCDQNRLFAEVGKRTGFWGSGSPQPEPRKAPKPKGKPDIPPPWQRSVDDVYVYPGTEADTRPIEVVRFSDGREPRFMQRQPIGNGRWKWSVEDIADHDRRLYRLAELRAAPIEERIWICAGEKDTDRLRTAGQIGTTNIGGEGKWRDAYAEEFRDRHCIALQDNDAAGAKHVADVARSLAGIAASIKVLLLPGLKPKGDVSDFLDAGHTLNELNRLADEAPEYRADSGNGTPPPEVKPKPGRILSGAAFMSSFVPPDWLIDGIVQRGKLYACTSLTGHGKTAIWLYLACMIQAGRMVGNLDVCQGNVVYLAGENPEDLKARMHGMAAYFNLKASEMPYVLPGNFPLNEQEADALIRDLNGLRVPLSAIIGDTASSYFPGADENDNVQAGGYGRTLRRPTTECDGNPTLIALCHPVKNATRSNLLPRGGGAFLNELDGNLTGWSESMGEVTEMHWQGKIRGPDFATLAFRLRPVPTSFLDRKDRPVMTIVAEPMSEEAAADHTKQTIANDDVVLRALRDQPGKSWAQIARDAGWVNEDDQPMKAKVGRAIRSLVEDKLVQQPRKGAPWELTEKGEKALDKDRP
jgi:AAA domain